MYRTNTVKCRRKQLWIISRYWPSIHLGQYCVSSSLVWSR